MVRIAPTLLRILFQFSLRNLCAQDWVLHNPKGLTDEFATYWNGLAPEEVMVGCILSSLITYLSRVNDLLEMGRHGEGQPKLVRVIGRRF